MIWRQCLYKATVSNISHCSLAHHQGWQVFQATLLQKADWLTDWHYCQCLYSIFWYDGTGFIDGGPQCQHNCQSVGEFARVSPGQAGHLIGNYWQGHIWCSVSAGQLTPDSNFFLMAVREFRRHTGLVLAVVRANWKFFASKDKKYLRTNIWVVSEIEENYEIFLVPLVLRFV